MTPIEAAEVIEAMAASFRANPAQFTIEIHMTGQKAMNTGGIGFASTAIGDGPGSTTIGNQVTVGQDANIEFKAKQAFDQQGNAMLQTLQTIAAELRKPQPDRSLIQRAMASLKSAWVPGVITSVAGNVLTKALGL
jgi:hypothetical protein